MAGPWIHLERHLARNRQLAVASEDRLLLICLIGGISASIIGMALRWISYQIEEHRGSGAEVPRTDR